MADFVDQNSSSSLVYDSALPYDSAYPYDIFNADIITDEEYLISEIEFEHYDVDYIYDEDFSYDPMGVFSIDDEVLATGIVYDSNLPYDNSYPYDGIGLIMMTDQSEN